MYDLYSGRVREAEILMNGGDIVVAIGVRQLLLNLHGREFIADMSENCHELLRKNSHHNELKTTSPNYDTSRTH